MKLRAVVFGALVIAATVGVPAAAEEGIHVSPGATDSYGCYAIEVWNGDVLVRTIPASPPAIYATLHDARTDRLPAERHPPVRRASRAQDRRGHRPLGVGQRRDDRRDRRARASTRSGLHARGRGGSSDGRPTSPRPALRRRQHPDRRHAWHPGIDLVPSASHPERMAGVRRAPWPHLLQRHGPHEGPRAVGEQRHHRGHPRRQGHPAGRTWLVSPRLRLSSDGTRLRFTADDGTGRRWWVSDGTRDGTHPE